MIRLVRVELRRLLSRRLVRLLGALLLAGLVTVVVGNAVTHDTDVAAARAKADRQLAAIGQVKDEAIQQCLAEAKNQGVPPEEFHCRPTAAEFFQDPRFRITNGAKLFAGVAVGFSAAFAVVMAVGVVGAEWAAGTYAALLLWEPRRLRVLASKLSAIVLAAAVTTALTVALMLGAAWVVASTRGTLAGGAGAAVADAAKLGGRGVLAVTLLSLIMAALANLVRSTAGALGIVAVYTVAVENVLRIFRPQWTRWQLGPNIVALIQGNVPLETTRPPSQQADFSSGQVFVLHADRAALYLTVLAAVFILVSAVVLRRRDVT